MSKRFQITLVVLLVGLAFYRFFSHPVPVIDRHVEPNPALLTAFEQGPAPTAAAYDKLFIYFLQGFENRRSSKGALAFYPGLPSRHGTVADALEGFSRSAPLWAAWVNSGRSSRVDVSPGVSVDLSNTFRRGLIAGVDRHSVEYWGDISDLDQRIVEASDVALSLWLLKDSVWPSLNSEQQANVVHWLSQSTSRQVSDNNWHLFSVFIGVVLHALTEQPIKDIEYRHYSRFKTFYRGEGWFSDGPGQVFDFYNGWAIQYQLFWIDQVNPDWDHRFIQTCLRQFADTYKYLVSPSGVPIEGRSICYRMAAPAPLIFAQSIDHGPVPPSEARRALDSTWRFFVRNHGLEDGNITQGYCREDPRVLDNYSGPASCLWGLRSLVLAFYLVPSAPFWRTEPGLLQVEQHSFDRPIASIGWSVKGDQRTGEVVIEKHGESASLAKVAEYSLARRLASTLLWRPFRPENLRAKYGLDKYSSLHPFCGCE